MSESTVHLPYPNCCSMHSAAQTRVSCLLQGEVGSDAFDSAHRACAKAIRSLWEQYFLCLLLIYSLTYFDIFLMWMNANFQTAHLACPQVSRYQYSILPSQVFLGVTNILSPSLASLDFSWRVNACPWLGAPVVLFIGQWKWKKKKKVCIHCSSSFSPILCLRHQHTTHWKMENKNKNKKKVQWMHWNYM